MILIEDSYTSCTPVALWLVQGSHKSGNMVRFHAGVPERKIMKQCQACGANVYEPGSNYQLLEETKSFGIKKWIICRYCLWKVKQALGIKDG